MKIVGNNARDYNNFRNINSVPFTRYQYERIWDFYNVLNYAHFKVFNKNKLFWLTYHWSPFGGKADILHFFNKISGSSTPWVTTFETGLPRWDKTSKKGMRLMAGKACKKLIAMSQAAYDIQHLFLEETPDYADEIKAKLTVIHPGQKLLIDSMDDKTLNDDLFQFTLIGNQIFSKGGREAVRMTKKLKREGYPVQLNLISGMLTDAYATHTTEEDVAALRKEIEEGKDCINFLGRIPNTQVLDLLKKSHVSLLPTYADTYGYAVLEAQAAGCPVITTDIRALPEINGPAHGWVIEVPKNELKNGVLKTEKDRQVFYETVESGLYQAMKNAMDNPAEIRAKGAKALERIRQEHDPADRAAKLEAIYDAGLSG